MATSPHSIAEDLILPAAILLVETMLDKKAADVLKTVVRRRIDDMATNIVEQVVTKMNRAGQFALHSDEMTDVSGEAQLLAFVRYKEQSDIHEHILFCKKLTGQTTGEEIFQLIDSFFKDRNHAVTSVLMARLQ